MKSDARAVRGEPQVAETGIVGLELRFQLITIEIHERDLAVRKLIAEVGLVQEQIRVAMMPWPFTHRYGSRIQAEEGFGRGADELRIGIHWFSRDTFNNIGFKQNRFSADVEMEEPKTVKH